MKIIAEMNDQLGDCVKVTMFDEDGVVEERKISFIFLLHSYIRTEGYTVLFPERMIRMSWQHITMVCFGDIRKMQNRTLTFV